MLRRLSFVGLLLASVAADARAGGVTSVLAPVSEGKVSQRYVERATASIRKAVRDMGTVSVPDYDVPFKLGRNGAECVVDPTCLVEAGEVLGSSRVLGIHVTRDGQTFNFTLVLVDVDTRTVVLEALEALPKRKLANGTGPLVVSFLRRAPTPEQRADALIDEGNEHYRAGDYNKALEKYSEAERLNGNTRVKFHLAECHRQLGNHQQAVDLYQAYLDANPTAGNRAAVEGHIAASKKRTSTELAKIEAERRRAEEAARAERERRRLLLEQRESQRVRYDSHPIRPWTYVGAGVGLVALGTGGYFALESRDNQSTFDDLGCGDRDSLLGPDDVARCDDLADRGDRNSLLGNVLGATGIGLVVTSTVLFIIDPGSESAPAETRAVQFQVGPSSIRATFTW